MRLLKMLLPVLLVCAAVRPAFAGPFEDGLAAYDRDDYATALRLWRPLADAGDATAQYNLGIMYRNGRGVPQDNATAVSWYGKAAKQGDAHAQINLGFMYERGQGVPQDNAMAVSWYRKAAEHGEANGQYNLGIMYETGRGVPQDYVQAHMWFTLAASNAHDEAINDRERVAARMTPVQIVEAQRLALEWKPKPNQALTP